MGKSRRDYRGGWIELAEIWHMDPCKDGTDDSCGYFLRARHGDQDTLERIVKRLEQDWDNTYTSDSSGETYNRGYFDAVNGSPVMSASAIMLNIFLMAAGEHYDKGRRQWDRSWRKARAYMRRHLFDILLFAENPTDSALDSIRQTFVSSEDMINDGGRRAKERRDQRIRQMASMVYGCILRDTRPWWKSRNLHIHHWRIKIHALRLIIRYFTKCARCRKFIRSDRNLTSDWSGKNLTCSKCNPCAVPQTQKP